jgi:putative peptidoglycan binding protein
MSRWTTLPISLILLTLGAATAGAADDLPRNIELKPGAEAAADKTAADTSTTEDKTRQIVTEGKDAAPGAAPPADAAGKPDTPKEGEGASTAAPASGTPAAETPAAVAPAAKEAASPESAPAGGKPPQAEVVAAPPPGPSPVELRPEELVLAVQTELKRVGCDPGDVDGVWGGQSREALAAFGHFAKVDVAQLAPTAEILTIIKGKGAVVCVAAGEPSQPGEEAGEPAPAGEPYHSGGGGYGGGGGGY